MPEFEIRQVPIEEAKDLYHALGAYAFRGDHPPYEPQETFNDIFKARPDAIALLGFTDDEPVVCAFYSPMVQNVRGVLRSCSAVWGVASHPRVRRRGYVREIMQHLLRHSAEAFPFSTLYPFRSSFYGRLGYTPFHEPVAFTVPTVQLRPALRMDLPGTLEDSTLRESFARFLHFAEAVQRRQHGMGIFAHADVRNIVHRRDRYAVYAVDELTGETIGAMTYRIDEDRNLRVWPFFTLNPLGRYLLLSWLARHIDQCPNTRIYDLPPAERPNTWLPDLSPTYEDLGLDNIPMGRVTNLRGLVRLPVGEGAVTVRVHDQHAPWNEGVVRMYGVDGELYLDSADDADCDLTVHGITALVYGTHDPATFRYLGWGNPDEATQAALRALFPPAWPLLFEVF